MGLERSSARPELVLSPSLGWTDWTFFRGLQGLQVLIQTHQHMAVGQMHRGSPLESIEHEQIPPDVNLHHCLVE